MDKLDIWLLAMGIGIMGWAQFGNPAEPTAAFALGAGLSIKGLLRSGQEFHKSM